MGLFAWKYVVPAEKQKLFLPGTVAEAIKKDRKDGQPFRVMTVYPANSMGMMKPMAHGLQNINGYSMVHPQLNKVYAYWIGTMPSPRNMVIKMEAISDQTKKFAEFMNVDYFISGQPFGPALEHARSGAARGLATDFEYAASFSAPLRNIMSLLSPEALLYTPELHGKISGEER